MIAPHARTHQFLERDGIHVDFLKETMVTCDANSSQHYHHHYHYHHSQHTVITNITNTHAHTRPSLAHLSVTKPD